MLTHFLYNRLTDDGDVASLIRRPNLTPKKNPWAMGWMDRVRFLPAQILSLLHSTQTDSRVHPAFYQLGTGGDFRKVKR
jgi:ribosomal protein L19E